MPNFKHPAFVKVDDAQQRKELIEWLEMVGYKIDKWVDSSNSKWKYIIAFDGIVQTECEDPLMDIDCGTNIALFKAIAAINNENDYMQWFSYTEYPTDDYKNGIRRIVFNKNVKFDSFSEMPSGYYRKATIEELIEHFKKLMI